MLKPKPSWLRAITPKGSWVTIYPNIYYPESVIDPNATYYADIIVHETVHLRQQEEMGVEMWLLSYFADPRFRVEQECEAAAEQIMSAPHLKNSIIYTMCSALMSSTYFYATSSFEESEKIILDHLDRMGFVEPPPFPPLNYAGPNVNTPWWTEGWEWNGKADNITPLRPLNSFTDDLPPWDYDIPGSYQDFEYYDRKGKA